MMRVLLLVSALSAVNGFTTTNSWVTRTAPAVSRAATRRAVAMDVDVSSEGLLRCHIRVMPKRRAELSRAARPTRASNTAACGHLTTKIVKPSPRREHISAAAAAAAATTTTATITTNHPPENHLGRRDQDEEVARQRAV